MKQYEGTLLQEVLTVPLSFIAFALLLWLAVVAGLVYLMIVI